MFAWIAENIGTVLICAALVLIVAVIIRGILRDRARGKNTCGAGCAHCAMSGYCHKK